MLADMMHRFRPGRHSAAGEGPLATKVVACMRKTQIWEGTQRIQRLRHHLREYFPAALEAFEDLAAPGALELLVKAPDPARARRLTCTQVTVELTRARRRDIVGKTGAVLAALSGEQLGQPAALTAAYAAARSLIAVITALREQVKTLQGQVKGQFGRRPDAEIYLSQPSIGVMLGESGDDPIPYASTNACKNYGVASPITCTLGEKNVVAAWYIRNDRPRDAPMAMT